MPILTIDRIPHLVEWVTASGDPPEGHKPVMVFVHGWGGSARYWHPVAAALASTFDCLLYDLRGFGRTAGLAQALDQVPPDQAIETFPNNFDPAALENLAPVSTPNHANPLDPVYEMGAYAEDLAAILAQLNLKEVTVMAHSMGASIATLLAGLKDPQGRIKRLILTCSGIFTYNRLSFQAFHLGGGLVTSFRPGWLRRIPGMGRLFTARFLHQQIPEEQRLQLLEDYLMADPVAVEGTIYTAVSVQATQEMPQAFRALRIPTLLIAGEFDQIIPTRLAEQAVAQNPEQICYVEMPGVGHFPMLEDPEGYLQVLGDFLGRESIEWKAPQVEAQVFEEQVRDPAS